MEINYTTLADIQQDIRDGVITVEELVKHYLNNTEANQSLNAFLEVYAEEALAPAQILDQKLLKGETEELAEEATIIGRQNCDEFGIGFSSENSAFGLMKNGDVPSRVPGGSNQNPLEMYLEDIFIVQASLTGLPAISIPEGTDKSRLPIGLQLLGSAFNKRDLLSFSMEIVSLS